LAVDVDKAAPRMFRMDRLTRPRLLREISFVPDVQRIRPLLRELPRWRPLTGRWSS
jgi:hypothetical protein